VLFAFAISCIWSHRAGRRALMAGCVLLVTLAVLSIFFFPAHQGPYAVTHGPVTELRSLLPSASLLFALILLTVTPLFLTRRLALLGCLHFSEPGYPVHATSSLHEVFRC
jgi:hypothetical protein